MIATPRRPAARVLVVLAAAAALLVAARCGERTAAVDPAHAGAAAGAPGALPAAKRPPDVLLLVMDTVRADRCSFLGYGRPTTPHLEELARDAIVFTDAWSPSSWTLPAHAALFTGRHPETIGAVGPSPRPIPPDVPTLASLLAASGFATACFTGNPWIADHSGLSRGFALMDKVYDDAQGPTARAAHARALQWMRARRAERTPFLAFVNDVEPHMPRTPPPELQRRFVAEGTPRAALDLAKTIRNPRIALIGLGFEPSVPGLAGALSDLYDAELAQLDDEIGALVRGMREAGLLDGTLVIVVSDHGEGLGDHTWLEHGVFLDRELLRVPLLVRPPGGTAARTVAEVVRVEDVFAEVLAQCGVAAPEGTTAQPLSGAVSGRVALASERVTEDLAERLTELRGKDGAEVLRTWRRSACDGRWHLIVDDRGGVRLFDVREDPGETTDVSAAQPGVVTALRARIDAVPRLR